VVDNLREVIRYPSYNPPGTPRAAFIEWWPAWGSRVGWALTAVMAVILVVEWWSNRKAEFRGLLWTVCLTLVVAQWIGIQTDPGNFIVIFPAMILVFSQLDARWKLGGRVFIILCLLVLFAAIWAIFINTLEVGAQPVQSAVMFFPLPAFMIIALYWVRWWTVQPPAVWYDLLEGR
jgi:cell division protein FtsW (lipid II flippase)